MSRLLSLLAAALALSACATGPATSPSASQPASGAGPANTVPEPATPAPGSAATAALLDQSRTERNAGDLGRAAATIERALAIAPEDPALWVELAEIRADQGDRVLAAEMARKALTLTSDDSDLGRRARRLISR